MKEPESMIFELFMKEKVIDFPISIKMNYNWPTGTHDLSYQESKQNHTCGFNFLQMTDTFNKIEMGTYCNNAREICVIVE